MKNINIATLIGRFSPPHKEHLNLILNSFEFADNLIVCIGSANAPRNIKNPWTAEERKQMILSAVPTEYHNHIFFAFIEDRLYQNNEWANLVRTKVREISNKIDEFKTNFNYGLIAAEKDDTSWYINLFPEWKKLVVNVSIEDNENPIGATKIRELLFTGYTNFVKHILPNSVFKLVKQFTKTEEFQLLKQEYVDGISYEKLYENHPKGHNINFFTCDAVVTQSGHILLIKRKKSPGAGLWAIPGGHVDANENSLEAILRELDEETNLKVPKKVLLGSIKHKELFEHPDRSMRARITKKNARSITMAYCFKLEDTHDLPRVKAGDDADDVRWFPIETVVNTMRDQLFEDHIDIITTMIAKLD